MELKVYAVGRRRQLTACADKDQDNSERLFLVPAKAVTRRFALQRRTSVPRFVR